MDMRRWIDELFCLRYTNNRIWSEKKSSTIEKWLNVKLNIINSHVELILIAIDEKLTFSSTKQKCIKLGNVHWMGWVAITQYNQVPVSPPMNCSKNKSHWMWWQCTQSLHFSLLCKIFLYLQYVILLHNIYIMQVKSNERLSCIIGVHFFFLA